MLQVLANFLASLQDPEYLWGLLLVPVLLWGVWLERR